VSPGARQIDHVWVTVSDGARLAARIWLPAAAEPVPAVLIATPYRKDDVTAIGDERACAWLAAQGFAVVRLDMRGTGSSDGIQADEYLPIEQRDVVDAITWIAAQDWCTGAVGMQGISWGGFAALQAASHRPPALRAAIAICSTDDRYSTDIHLMGGAMLASEQLSWATTMLAYNARPPDPVVVGESWRDRWRERLEATEPWIHTWLSHPCRDPYWRNGSLGDGAEIACPVLMVGGWADGYRDAVLRFLERSRGPRAGLIGPWSHGMPDAAVPGPRIDWGQEMVGWWNRWLKDDTGGVEDVPMLRAWLPAAGSGGLGTDDQPGRWVALDAWPPPSPRSRTLGLLADGSLGEPDDRRTTRVVESDLTHGLEAGRWFPLGRKHDLPPEQSPDDDRSSTWTSAPLDAPLEMLGTPVARLSLAADADQATVAVRLCDVDPAGQSWLIARGIRNLSLAEEDGSVSALRATSHVEVPLSVTGWTFGTGHRIRVAVAPGYWPWTWPSPTPVTLQVTTNDSTIELPLLDTNARPIELSAVPPASTGPDLIRDGPSGRRIELDGTSVTLHLEGTVFAGRRAMADGTIIDDANSESYSIDPADPLSATANCRWQIEIRRSGWWTRVVATSSITLDASHYFIDSTLAAFCEDRERPWWERSWHRRVARFPPRDPSTA
jgi:hypothetical protein